MIFARAIAADTRAKAGEDLTMRPGGDDNSQLLSLRRIARRLRAVPRSAYYSEIDAYHPAGHPT